MSFQIYNFIYNTYPSIIHGNGPSKVHLNYLSNYLDPLKILTTITQSTVTVLLGIFIQDGESLIHF